jgi:integrase
LFPKQAANSLVTETLQYFVFFCRSVYYAIFAKCLIINDLRLILVILFFIAFLNFTYSTRHTFAVLAILKGMPLETLQKVLGHKSILSTQVYAELINPKVGEDTDKISEKIGHVYKLAM